MIHKRVLLIEDDIADQEFFVKALRRIPDTSLYGIAKNVKEALAMLLITVVIPDIIFMGCDIPSMSIKKNLSEILHNRDTCNIPVVILSGAVDQEEMFKQIVGAKAFIKKTPDIILLRLILDNIINQSLNLKYVETGYITLEKPDFKPLNKGKAQLILAPSTLYLFEQIW